MAETITVPAAFDSQCASRIPQTPSKNTAHTPQSKCKEAPKASEKDGTIRKKQSKSRNGMFQNTDTSKSLKRLYRHAFETTTLTNNYRLCHVQSKTSQMRRGQTHLRAVQEAQCNLRRLQEGFQMATLRRAKLSEQAVS